MSDSRRTFAIPPGCAKTRVAALAVLACLIIIWGRTGRVPAPSGGDEVWWSESAWHWLHGEGLRWACLDDDKGSALISYWPPAAPLLQAGMIQLFGLTPFGIMAQSSLVCTLIMALVYGLSRTGGLHPAHSLWCAVAVFGLLLVERRLLQVRMENLTALAGLGGLLLLARSGNSWLRHAAAGLVLAAGLYGYYPQSPFLLLGAAALVLLLPSVAKPQRVAAICLGALPLLVAGVLWIAPHRELFVRQVLAVGTSQYLSPDYLVRPFRELLTPATGLRWWLGLEKWGVLLLALWAWRHARVPLIRAVAVLTVTSSLPMFFYDSPPQVLAGLLGVLLVFLLAADCPVETVRRGLGGLRILLVSAALLKLSLIGYTAWAQREGRAYGPVAARLTARVHPEYRTAISQEAWLALRAHVPADNLHLLPYAPPSTENRPRAARILSAAEYYDCLVLQRGRLPALRQVYPWLGPALDSGHFQEVESIMSTFVPLPWAKEPNYDLVVYLRRNGAPATTP